MSEKEKKTPEKSGIVPAKKVPVKAERAIRPRRHVQPTNVLATFDDLLGDFRSSFRDSLWDPWESAILPYDVELPVRAAYSDLIDEGDRFLVRAEVPGIPKNKIEVNITKDGIEISGETGSETEEKEKNYVVRERSYSSIFKNIAWPEEVIPEKAECTLKNGLLEVTVPKKTLAPPIKRHRVEVKEAK